MPTPRRLAALLSVLACTLAPSRARAELAFVAHWGEFGTGPGQFRYPTGVAIAPGGDIFVADGGNNRVCRFTPDGQFVETIGSPGGGPGQFQAPDYLQFSPANGDLYVTDKNNHRIQRFTEDGTYVLEWGALGVGPGQFNAPWGIHIGASGDVWVTSREQNRVQKFTADGQFLAEWGSTGSAPGQFLGPHGITTDDDGNVYVVDAYRYDVQKFDAAGSYLLEWGSEGSDPGEFLHPQDLTFASGSIVVVDFYVHPHAGKLTSFSTSGELQEIMAAGPVGTCDLCFTDGYDAVTDGAGLWYVVEWSNHRIKKLREAVSGVPAGRSDARILGAPVPNPSTGSVRFPLAAPGADRPHELAVFDVRGELIFTRHLPAAAEFLWEGTDRTGAPVGAGVYFVQVRGHGFRETRKVVRVR